MDEEILSKLIITKFCSVSDIYNEKNTCVKRGPRGKWAVSLKYEGETRYNSGGREYISNINNVIILPKDACYEWLCTESGRCSIIEFEAEPCCDKVICLTVNNGERLLRLFKSLEYKSTLKRDMYGIEAIRDIYTIILTLQRSSVTRYVPVSKADKLRPSLEYIAKNYNRKMNNDFLASLSGMSTVYFRKLFTEVTGLPPVTYINTLRTEKAKEMLKSDYGSISDIACSLGYQSIYDFSRTFRKYAGIAPTGFLKNSAERKDGGGT